MNRLEKEVEEHPLYNMVDGVTWRNSTTQTYGLASQDPGPWIFSQRLRYAQTAVTPSARASASLISCSRSTRTAVISRVIRLAQRGMKIGDFQPSLIGQPSGSRLSSYHAQCCQFSSIAGPRVTCSALLMAIGHLAFIYFSRTHNRSAGRSKGAKAGLPYGHLMLTKLKPSAKVKSIWY